ncbi:hypothetical protein TcG_07997 [Trypanosoma cruzi]|nr:hypothetical protein TcG_07997 [Trypanosoma cruzi]
MSGRIENDRHHHRQQQQQQQPYLIMRLNRKPAVGPSCRVACNDLISCGDVHHEPSSRSSSDGCYPPMLSPLMDVACADTTVSPASVPEMKSRSSFSSAPPKSPPYCVDGSHATRRERHWRNTQRFYSRSAHITRAVSCHLEGGAALVTGGPLLLFAGRGTAPSGTRTAMEQHLQLFRDPTVTAAPAQNGNKTPIPAAGTAHCRQARLVMLRGNGPLW